jgi:outer membrane usher protein
VVSLGHSFSMNKWGYLGLSASQIRFEQQRSLSVNASWSIPLGKASSASVAMDRARAPDGSNHKDSTVTIRREMPTGDGFGYFAQASQAGRRQGELDYQMRAGTYSLQLAQDRGETAARVSASGGIGFIDGRTFFSRNISESFGLVRLPGYEGVRIYSQNQVVGKTNADGEFVVPRLLPYQANVLRIEHADLPPDAQFEKLEQTVVPFARSGAVVTFAVRSARGAIVVIQLEDGRPVPAGAVARLNLGAESFPIALEGEAYLTGLASRNLVVVRWASESCAVSFAYLGGADPQPRLGPFVCRSMK